MRIDILRISEIIRNDSTVLDLGCGQGELLFLLKNKKNAIVKGIDINEKNVLSCIEKGLSVFHGDMEEVLPHNRTKYYDYVVLSLTLHQVKNPEKIIDESVRVGKKVIISFPNFAYWKIRLKILLNGRLPSCDYSKYEWFTENYVHFITVKEFENFCNKKGYEILSKNFLPEFASKLNPDLFSSSAIYCIRSRK